MSDPTRGPAPIDPWTKLTKDRWFFGTLAAATVALIYLLSPFATTLLFAAVFVVVTWPLFDRILHRVKQRRLLAAALTLGVMGAVVFGPIGYLGFLFAREALGVAQAGADFVQGGDLAAWVKWAVGLPQQAEQWLPDWLPTPIREVIVDAVVQAPQEADVASVVYGPLRTGALSALNAAGSAVPALVNAIIDASIDTVIFVFALFALYMDGPRVLRVIKNMVPLDDAYSDRLFAVFAEISNNLVIGTILSALTMAFTSFVGYTIAGVNSALFFAILTGIGSFVPVVGTAVVVIPVCVSVGFTYGAGWALFLVIYSVVVTGNVDTFMRPMFMRGSTHIHPLLIFLAVFGGMGWMGLPGALVGPVIVAFFLALYTIFVQNYLGVPVSSADGAVPSLSATLRSARERVLTAVRRASTARAASLATGSSESTPASVASEPERASPAPPMGAPAAPDLGSETTDPVLNRNP